ncbi:RICIN domain-containing protein [Streptomyces sp. NBC_01294]|uniref:RICIN domain-containing protein n=1 Tax=Streptomyces sp. NBC_01294 TaxID=2903815 RepID=UPI002DD8F72B|nr:RICIN domain-containing protein [Streptomyces sp. NBC_01294]WRZ56723.1 RICIN domain-containing protein [Streptomyces sp. NBC_01294]
MNTTRPLVKRSRVALAGLLLASALVSTTGTATATAAADAAVPARALDSVQTFRNGATSACLDDSEAGVRTYTCLGNEHQKWNVHQWADGTRELKNRKTGLCLTDHPRGTVTPQPCDKAKDESWFVHRYPDGAVEFKNQATGLCLDDSFEHRLRTFPCGTHSARSPYQTWH